MSYQYLVPSLYDGKYPKLTNPDNFPAFGKLSRDDLRRKYDELLDMIVEVFKKRYPKEAFPKSGDILDKLRWDESTIYKIVDLVERRRVYFRIYHHETAYDMGELNEICLQCFWILKLSPFRVENCISGTNVFFASLLFAHAIRLTASKKGKVVRFGEHIAQHINHAFKYRDLSKEAIMALAEGLIHVENVPKTGS